MIYITGDTHADFSRFLIEKFPVQTEMNKEFQKNANLRNGSLGIIIIIDKLTHNLLYCMKI